jgi:mRNA interferase MazF
MTSFNRGDVVVVDLGYAGKIRPCIVLSEPGADPNRNMSIVAPLTTEIRGGKSEVPFEKPFWLRQTSVVNVLGISGVDNAKIVRRLAQFPKSSLSEVYARLDQVLGK